MAKQKMVKIVVGGIPFATRVKTLLKHPNTLLSSLDHTSEFYDSKADEYFFDRDPQAFACVLNYYRTSELHLPSGLCGNAIRNELTFWQIPESCISECCWRVMHSVDQNEVLMNNLRQKVERDSDIPELESLSGFSFYRHRLFLFLKKPNSSTGAKIWNFIYMMIVLLSAVLLTLASLPQLRERYSVDEEETKRIDQYLQNSTRYKFDLYAHYRLIPTVYIVEKILVGVFTLELTIHFFVYHEKKQFFFSILNCIDVIATMSGLLSVTIDMMLTNKIVHPTEELYWMYFVLRCFMGLRLLRFFRLKERYTGLKIMFLVIQKSAKELMLLILCFVILSTIFGTLEYYCEFENQKISSIPVSIWWSIITMTTVGYGDFYPESLCGYLLGTLCSMCGIVFLSIPIALIAATFKEYYNGNQQRELFRKHQAKHRKPEEERELTPISVIRLRNSIEQ